MSHALFERHRETILQAVKTLRSREYWSPYPEMPSPKVYGEQAQSQGEAAFKAYLGQPFELTMPGISGHHLVAEQSPYGFDLKVHYPQVDLDELISGMQESLAIWRDAGIETRTGVCLEILKRLNQRSFELAFSVMHTTGQAFMMAFQAGGPHAQDRALEAIAYAYDAMTQIPQHAQWTKPQGKHDPLVMDKSFHIVPRGLGLVIGCSTFPTWNTYPGLFANLVTGNPTMIKPHPTAILPAAITVKIAQEVLTEFGFPAHIVSLVVDCAEKPISQTLALRDEVRLIDFTGNNEFGTWLEQNAHQAQCFTEKAGVNTIVIDSSDDFKGLVRNLSFSLSLYSGQMCTTPQNIYVPKSGIETEQGHLSFDQVAQALADGVAKFLSNNERAVEVLGAIQSQATLERLNQAKTLGTVVLESEARNHPAFEQARIHTPTILTVEANATDSYLTEQFGPISFIIATENTQDSIQRATQSALSKGAMTWACYSSSPEVLSDIETASLTAGVALSCNLTGGIFVNQSAAFSDFHGTGCNPAANASLSDAAYVANRFRIVQSRRHSQAA